jgi:CubicO group peptidase (beta-lactamase class C family)
VAPAEETVPSEGLAPPYSNQTDHCAGPRLHDSGDTGSLMPVSDYARFLDFLLAGGVSHAGERLLSEAGVAALTTRRFQGLAPGPLGGAIGLGGEPPAAGAAAAAAPGGPPSGYPQSFNFGWAVTHRHSAVDDYQAEEYPCCFWSGYANSHVRFYAEEDSYVIIGTQLMDHHFTNGGTAKLREPIVRAFLDAWR